MLSQIRIPLKELVYIEPKDRDIYFVKLIKELKSRYADLKLSYAYINKSSEFKCDYLIIYKYIQKNKYGEDIANGIAIIYQPIYSQYSLPGYRYCIKNNENNMLDKWFEFIIHDMICMPDNNFFMLMNKADLTVNEKDDNYWKNPKMFKKLENILSDTILTAKGRIK